MNGISEQPLAVLLGGKMRQDGLTLDELAAKLSIGQSYMSQLLRGVRPMDAVGDEFVRACAEYLGIPAVTVYLLAGRLKASDFFENVSGDLLAEVDEALRTIAESRLALEASVTLNILLLLPNSVKLLLVQMFEQLTSTPLLPKRVGASDIENFGKISVPFSIRQHLIEK